MKKTTATVTATTTPATPAAQPSEVESSQLVLSNTDAALGEIASKIATAQDTIMLHQGNISEIDLRLATSMKHIIQLEEQCLLQEDAVRQSKSFAFLSKGSSGVLERAANETAKQ